MVRILRCTWEAGRQPGFSVRYLRGNSVIAACLALLLLALGSDRPLFAQFPAPPPAPAAVIRSPAELDQLLGPIALYPDPLIAQILPAATLPAQIVIADRFLQQGGDPNQIDFQPWDPSAKALARYPTVLKFMDDNIGWTTEVGQAFLYQQQDVMNSIQRLRSQALSLGNLQSTPQQTVMVDNGIIEIVPANPQVIYVPVYQPQVVYVQRPPRPGFFISFGIGLGIGAWLNHDFDWHRHEIVEWHRDHPRPADWWSRPPNRRPEVVVRREASVWRPQQRTVIAPVNRGDRGWGERETRPAPAPRTAPSPVISRPAEPRPAPARPVAPSRPTGGALVGVHSEHDTRQFSNRGQQSRGTITRPSEPAHAAPSAPNVSRGGPGGGDRRR